MTKVQTLRMPEDVFNLMRSMKGKRSQNDYCLRALIREMEQISGNKLVRYQGLLMWHCGGLLREVGVAVVKHQVRDGLVYEGDVSTGKSSEIKFLSE